MAKFVFEFEAPEMDDDELDLVADAVRTVVRDMTRGPLRSIIVNGNILSKEEL